MPYQYNLSPEQIKKYEEWRATKVERRTAIGGAVTFQFTPTSIGVVVKAVWLIGTPAEDSIDLSDYDNW